MTGRCSYLDSAGNFASAQATGACVDILGRTLHDRLDTTDIRLPGTVGTAMGVGDLDTKGNTLAAAFTLSHGNCTSYSEVWNQNNQLDYFTRDTKKKQAFF